MSPQVAQWLSFFWFALAGVIHIIFFYIESIQMQKSSQSADVKLWAFNQGIYNLCLALGVFAGLYFIFQKQIMFAGLLTSFCGIFMIVAGLALAYSAPSLRRWAILQAGPPILGFIFLYFHVRAFIS